MSRIKCVDGVHFPFTAEEEAARDIEEAAWRAGKTDRSWDMLRNERNGRLTETDWWASHDLTMSSARTEYRTALRDFPTTVDISQWPNVTWPVKPE